MCIYSSIFNGPYVLHFSLCGWLLYYLWLGPLPYVSAAGSDVQPVVVGFCGLEKTGCWALPCWALPWLTARLHLASGSSQWPYAFWMISLETLLGWAIGFLTSIGMLSPARLSTTMATIASHVCTIGWGARTPYHGRVRWCRNSRCTPDWGVHLKAVCDSLTPWHPHLRTPLPGWFSLYCKHWYLVFVSYGAVLAGTESLINLTFLELLYDVAIYGLLY